MQNTKWILNNICNKNNLVNGILNSRGISNEEDVHIFLHPIIDNLTPPSHYYDVEKAALKILNSIASSKSIWIYGDYDVDGITSTVLSYLSLRELGGNVNYYIPLRDEGYGLNCDALQFIKDNGGDLVITVDCGITSHKEINFGNSIGLDIIITDHHDILNSSLPDAFAIINPKREDNISKFKSLAGVGTVFMLLWELYIISNRGSDIFKYLDLVAIGTVADIVTLQGDNRILVKNGLKALESTKLPSLRSLLKVLFFENFDSKIYTPYDIGFIIAPIFNAAGRIEDAKTSVEFLISNDHTKYIPMIDSLIENNKKRKNLQDEILKDALLIIENKKLSNKNIILVGKTSFHHGVIGIVASKILDIYYKPTIILEINNESGIAKGSCRSTESFNMIEALTKNSKYLIKFGGHHGAAGFSIPVDKLDEFYNDMDLYCGSVSNDNDKLKPIKITSVISLLDVSFDIFKDLKLLEPYGFGNSSPLFAFHNIEFSNLKLIGKDKTHLTMTLIQDGIELKNAVFFNGAEWFEPLLNQKSISLVAKLKLEEFKGKFYPKVYIEDIKFSNSESVKSLDKFIKDNNLSYNTIPRNIIIYSNKKLNIGDSCEFKKSNDSFQLFSKGYKIGYTESVITKNLTNFKDANGCDFIGKVSSVLETNFNYHIIIEIEPIFNFKSFGVNKKKIFLDIKEYLIPNRDYSIKEKEVLRDIFNNNSSLILNLKEFEYIEFETILLTLILYFYSLNLKIDISNTVYENLFSNDSNFSSIFSLRFKHYLLLTQSFEISSNFSIIFKNLEIEEVNQLETSPRNGIIIEY